MKVKYPYLQPSFRDAPLAPPQAEEEEVPLRSDEYGKVNGEAFMRELMDEFDDSIVENGEWILFKVDDMLGFEIDFMTGIMSASTSTAFGPDFPHGDGSELPLMMKKLRKMMKLRNKLVEFGFNCANSGITVDDRYELKMVKLIESSDIGEIIADVKNLQQTLSTLKG